jgi:hypothetical protein
MIVFKKITRRQFDILSGGCKGELFLIRSDNKWIFRKGFFKGVTIEILLEQARNSDREDEFWEQMQLLYDDANWIDKMNIFNIYKELKTNKF